MKLKSIAAGIALIAASSLASAIVIEDHGSYTLTYDETTTFGSLASSFTAGGGAVGFNWAFSTDVQISSPGASAVFAMPDFTITVNPGFTLSGPLTSQIGNIAYFEAGGAVTSVTAGATISVDGGPAFVGSTPLTKVPSNAISGTFSTTGTAPIGGFSSFAVSASSITLDSTAGAFAGITAQPQNQYAISFVAIPVPEPESYAMLLAGIAVVGWVARRRRQS